MVGIDKVQLWAPLEQVGVKKFSNELFGSNRSTRQGGSELPHLFTDMSGEPVIANSIYHNSEIGQYSINQKGLLVQFNPSKLCAPSGNNYKLATTGKEFYQSVRTIEHELKQVGIITNLAEMRLCRLDLAKQAEMSNPFPTYVDAFLMLKGKRAKEQRLYPNGYTVGNKSWETIGYDKGQELATKGVLGIAEKNLMRLENRWLKAETISKVLGLTGLPDLADTSPAELTAMYKHHLNTRYFPKQFDGLQAKLDFDTAVSEMKAVQEMMGNKNGWLKDYLAAQHIDSLISGLGGVEMLRRVLSELAPKQTVSRWMKDVNHVLAIKAQLDRGASRVTVASLLGEIHHVFAA